MVGKCYHTAFYVSHMHIGNAITQRHEAVVQVDIFHNGVMVLHGDVIMAEVPEIFNSHSIQLVGKLFYRHSGDAQHRHHRLLLPAKGLQILDALNGEAAESMANLPRVIVKNTDKAEALGLEGKVGGNGLPQVSRANEDTFVTVGDPENIPDFITELVHHIAIALLSEAAEAV